MPVCGVVGKLTKIAGRRAYACMEGCHIYPCAGTIFEHSSTPLSLWFHAMYLMTATRNGVAAKELQRQLGVTYKCAWRIGHQLRELMSERAKAQNPGPLSGHVEIDETYIGGKLRKFTGFGKGHYLKNKATVFRHGAAVMARSVAAWFLTNNSQRYGPSSAITWQSGLRFPRTRIGPIDALRSWVSTTAGLTTTRTSGSVAFTIPTPSKASGLT